MLNSSPSSLRRGITLIELLLVIVMVGIMSAIALPRFRDMRQRLQLDAAAQQLVRDLNRARTEAVKRNGMVWLAKSSTTTYSVLHIGSQTLPNGVVFQSAPDTVKFAAFGPAITGAATFTLLLDGRTREVALLASGFASTQ